MLSFAGTADPPRPDDGGDGNERGTTPALASEIQMATRRHVPACRRPAITYFHTWYYSVNGSNKLTVNGFSGITQGCLLTKSHSPPRWVSPPK